MLVSYLQSVAQGLWIVSSECMLINNRIFNSNVCYATKRFRDLDENVTNQG